MSKYDKDGLGRETDWTRFAKEHHLDDVADPATVRAAGALDDSQVVNDGGAHPGCALLLGALGLGAILIVGMGAFYLFGG